MTHLEIREKFLNFFKERGHKEVPTSSLLPTDQSVLFTTAGVQQFKSYYTGQADPINDFGTKRVISIQKSLRTVDIDEVGDASHITFFEMLGYFSFGDYFKKETIGWAYDFVTKELGLAKERLKPTVFKGDAQAPFNRESFEIWQSLGFPEQKIGLGGKTDNFWGPTGNEGPCGPCDEVYMDNVEIGTLVFNEYYCDKEKNLVPLAQKGVDVGLGFERIVSFVQNVDSIYETDLFTPIMEEIRGKNLYDYEQNKISERIIADHLRASVFLISDGIVPSNVERGYVLRRLLRRAICHAKLLNLPEDLYERVVHVLAHDIYKEVYPELKTKQKEILETILAEKNKFSKTLERGSREFEKWPQGKIFTGKDAFNFYQNYGFPPELTGEILKERDISQEPDFNQQFENARKQHKSVSAVGSEKKFGGHGLAFDAEGTQAGSEEELAKITRLHTATHLLQAALIKVLGDQVKQAGSDINAERLRFDFTFPRKITAEELKEIEELVNEAINKNLPVSSKEMPYEEAIKTGALSFFKQKYPSVVKVYTIGDEQEPFSRELCGGPHILRTGEIGRFKIKKEEAISSGIRRVRAKVE